MRTVICAFRTAADDLDDAVFTKTSKHCGLALGSGSVPCGEGRGAIGEGSICRRLPSVGIRPVRRMSTEPYFNVYFFGILFTEHVTARPEPPIWGRPGL